MTHTQPDALIFANDRPTSLDDDLYQWSFDTEELIRRHHARITKLEDVADTAIKRIEELEAQLSAIGALIIQRTADARDAARYRWLRDNDWRNDEKMEPVIRLHLNAIWDEKIDAAMAASTSVYRRYGPSGCTKVCMGPFPRLPTV